MSGRGVHRVIALLVAANILVGTTAATRHIASGQRVGSAGATNGQSARETSTTTSTTTAVAADGASTAPEDPSTTLPGDSTTPTTSTRQGEAAGPFPSATTTTTAPAPTGPDCHNSHDPACGDFYWSPTPTNTPMEMQVTYEPSDPHVGDVVTFHVSTSDSESNAGGSMRCFGDNACNALADEYPYSAIGYGPWAAPSVRPSNTAYDYTHTYTRAGTFVAGVHFESNSYIFGDDCAGDAAKPSGSYGYTCFDPYAETRVVRVTITVNP